MSSFSVGCLNNDLEEIDRIYKDMIITRTKLAKIFKENPKKEFGYSLDSLIANIGIVIISKMDELNKILESIERND